MSEHVVVDLGSDGSIDLSIDVAWVDLDSSLRTTLFEFVDEAKRLRDSIVVSPAPEKTSMASARNGDDELVVSASESVAPTEVAKPRSSKTARVHVSTGNYVRWPDVVRALLDDEYDIFECDKKHTSAQEAKRLLWQRYRGLEVIVTPGLHGHSTVQVSLGDYRE